MRTTPRRAWLVIGAAVAGGVLVAPAGPSPELQNCPPGEHEDTQTPGFQCVSGWCPAGSLLDGVTHSCVAAPGVPPSALPSG